MILQWRRALNQAMNILLIIEGRRKEDSTFSILSLHENNLFLQFSPEFYIRDLNLGDLYAKGGIQAVEEKFGLPTLKVIDKFVTVSLENLTALLHHFFPEGMYDPIKKEQRLISEESIYSMLSYANNTDESFPTLECQKCFFEQLASRILRKRNLLRLPSIVKIIQTYIETDLDVSTGTKLLAQFINKPAQKITQVVFPLASTFRMVKGSEGSYVKIIDIARNEQYLRNLFLQEQLTGGK